MLTFVKTRWDAWMESCINAEFLLILQWLFFPTKEHELITKFLPMLMSFVVDDYTFNADQKLPSEEKGPLPYPNTIAEAFTKYVISLCTLDPFSKQSMR